MYTQDTKKEVIYQKTRKILVQHSVDGIFKNELIRVLDEKGICSRNTFYKYFEEMKKDSILEMRKFKNQQEKCFPTLTDNRIEEFQKKIKVADDLLKIIEKTPMVGDCFLPSMNDKRIYDWVRDYVPELPDRLPGGFLYYDRVQKTAYARFGLTEVIHVLKSRYHFLKNLPVFLIHYINHEYGDLSQQVREKCLMIALPYMIRCISLMQQEYRIPFYSNQLLEYRKQSQPKGTKFTRDINYREGDIDVDFLRILGRYYFMWCCEKENFEYDNDSTKKIIRSFIKTFIVQDNSDDLAEKIDESNSHDEDDKSIASRLEKSLGKRDEPYVVLSYYIRLFSVEGLFNKQESKLLRERLTSIGSSVLEEIKKARACNSTLI